jgi:hypothetical protein
MQYTKVIEECRRSTKVLAATTSDGFKMKCASNDTMHLRRLDEVLADVTDLSRERMMNSQRRRCRLCVVCFVYAPAHSTSLIVCSPMATLVVVHFVIVARATKGATVHATHSVTSFIVTAQTHEPCGVTWASLCTPAHSQAKTAVP